VSKFPQEELEEDHARHLKALVHMAGESLAGTLKNEEAAGKISVFECMCTKYVYAYMHTSMHIHIHLQVYLYDP
jgi:hypothetical protein